MIRTTGGKYGSSAKWGTVNAYRYTFLKALCYCPTDKLARLEEVRIMLEQNSHE
jgi:hypothetical protein